MEELLRATGAYGSGDDYRDHYALAASPLAAGVSVPDFVMPSYMGGILYQRLEPACVSHDIAKLMKLYWYQRTGIWIDFSPRFLDILSDEDWIPLEGGRVPRTVLKIATNIGCCTTKMLPNDTTLPIGRYRDKAVITPAMRAEAAKYKIPGFIYVPKPHVRNAVSLFGAVSTLFQIGDEFWIPGWDKRYTDPMRTPKVVISGHQMATNGFKGNLNNVENHWSEAWGDNGKSRYDQDAWSPFILENWAIAQIPPNVKEFLASLPSPSSFHYAFTSNLVQGMQNEQVKFLQVALMILDFMQPVPPDELGIFGPKTAAAVGAFQASRNINPVPSSCGPLTRGELNRIFAI
jgi:hypothetical protein